MPDIRSHRRVLDTFTGPVERPVLQWLAAHMPSWITPDILTGIGVVGGIIIFASYGLSGLSRNFLWLASLGFVVNWFGDSLDGTLARYRKIERPVYGFYIDHAVDAYIEIMIFLGLGLSPYVRFDLACLALVGYLLLSVLVFIRTCVKGEFTLSYGRLGPTEARLIAISANTLVYFIGNPFITVGPWTLTVYDWIAVFVILLLINIAVFTTIRQGRLLAEQDTKARLEKAAAAQNVPSAGKISHN
jgi:phosphatidylglycerophosphate synthase